MQPFRRFPGFGWLLAAACPFAFAQTTTGSVDGIVTAPSGPLVDADVRLVSSQVVRTTRTAKGGRFQAGLLNPGRWALTVTLAGYEALRTEVDVLPAESVRVRIRLAPAAAATVTVDGNAQPASASAVLTLSPEQFSRLPMARDMNDLAYLAPTATFGGRPIYPQARGLDYSFSGSSGNENQFVADGLVTTDLRFGGQGLALAPEFVASYQVETSGFKPEFNALGGVVNAVIRSGSNAFQGEAWTAWAPSSLSARAVANAAGFRQPAPADRLETGFGAGGPLAPDRTFYFAGVDRSRLRQRPDPNGSGFQGEDRTTGTLQTVLKVNHFLTPERQLTATWIQTRQREDPARTYPDGYGDADMACGKAYDTLHLSLAYDHALDAGLLLSLRAAFSRTEYEERPGDPATPSIGDAHWFNGGGGGFQPALATLTYQRGGLGRYVHDLYHTAQFRADLTWWAGAHAIKAGASHLQTRYWEKEAYTGGENLAWNIDQAGTGIDASCYGILGGSEVRARYQAVYAQDTWEATARLRATFGLRFDRQEQWDPQGRPRLRFTRLGRNLAPRLELLWDAQGDGRTMVSGSYAVYLNQMPQRLLMRGWGGETFGAAYYALTGYAAAGLGTFDRANPVLTYGLEPDTVQVASGTRPPRRRELALGLVRGLGGGTTLSLRAIFRHLTEPMDDTILLDRDGQAYMYTAGGQMIGLVWNPAPSVTFVAPPGAVDRNGQPIGGQTITVKDTLIPTGFNKYQAVTLGLRRDWDRGFVNAAYTWSHLFGNYEGLATPDRGAGIEEDAGYGPSFDAWPYVGTGNLGLDRRHLLKVFGSWRWTLPGCTLTAGARWTWQSGVPLSLQDEGSSTAGLPPGSLGVGNSLDPMYMGALTFDHGLVGNHGRSPSTSLADLRLEASFRTGRLHVCPSLDLFNVFNARTATILYQLATTPNTGEPDRRYGSAADWLPGRRIQVGVKVRF